MIEFVELRIESLKEQLDHPECNNPERVAIKLEAYTEVMQEIEKGMTNFEKLQEGQVFKLYDDDDKRYVKTKVIKKGKGIMHFEYQDEASTWNGMNFSDTIDDVNDYRIRIIIE